MTCALRSDARCRTGERLARASSLTAASLVVGVLMLVSWASGQSLVEAARTEKARRAAYKDRPIIIVTNRDLRGSTARSAAVPESLLSEASGDSDFVTAEARSSAPSEPIILATPPPPGGGSRRSSFQGPVYSFRQGDLSSNEAELRQSERIWQQAKDRADSLEIAVGGYTEDYYASRDRASRLALEKQIRETTAQYQRARDEEARAWVQMESLQNKDD